MKGMNITKYIPGKTQNVIFYLYILLNTTLIYLKCKVYMDISHVKG